jgi:hypothetical protein
MTAKELVAHYRFLGPQPLPVLFGVLHDELPKARFQSGSPVGHTDLAGVLAFLRELQMAASESEPAKFPREVNTQQIRREAQPRYKTGTE